MVLTPYTLRQLFEEEARRLRIQARVSHAEPVNPLAGCFDKQLAFILDPARRKAAICGRRAGKTHSMIRYMIKVAKSRSKALVIYIGITRRTAKDQIWEPLEEANRQLGLGAKFNKTDLVMTFPNGSRIQIYGADKKDQIEKLRGFAFDLVVLDEAGSYGAHFASLIEDVIEPGLEDYQGTLVMVGTPVPACVGYFHDATREDRAARKPGWSVHHWTVRDNPMFPLWAGREDWQSTAAAWEQGILDSKGWDRSNATWIRNYGGRWIQDSTGLVYHYDSERNHFDKLPDLVGFQHVLGVDLGFDDSFAVSALAFHEDRPDLWHVDEFKASELIPSKWAEILGKFVEQYNPLKIMVDTGGLGKAICEEFRQRYGLPVEPAQKQAKFDFQKLLNADLETGRLWIRKNTKTVEEMLALQWDEDHRKEDPRFDNHLCDSTLYGWREAFHWTHRVESVRLKPGEPGFADQEADDMEREAMEEFEDGNQGWWR